MSGNIYIIKETVSMLHGTPTYQESLYVHRPMHDNSGRVIILDMSDGTLTLSTCYNIQLRTCSTEI